MIRSIRWTGSILGMLLLAQATMAQPRLDVNGDALPPGAIARLGSLRWQLGGWVRGLDFSPDGTRLASGSIDNTVRIWDVASGREVIRLGKHDPWVTTVAYSPDGDMLASAGADEVISVWDPGSGKELRKLTGHSGAIAHIAFAPKGNVLASASGIISCGDATLRLWDAKAGKQLHQINHKGQVQHLAFDGSGRLIATACSDGFVRIFDAATAEEKHRFKGYDLGIGVTRIAFAPNARFIAAAGDHRDRTMVVWEVATGKVLKRVKDHVPHAFTPDGRQLASVLTDANGLRSSVVLWHVVNWSESKRIGPKPSIASVAFSRDGKTMAAGTGSTVHLWDVATGNERNAVDGHRADAIAVMFAPDGKSIATGSMDGSVRLWDASGRHLRMLADLEAGVPHLAFTAQGKQLVHVGADLRVCEVATGKELSKRAARTDEYIDAVLPDGKSFVTNTVDGVIQIWDTATQKPTTTMPNKLNEFIAISADARTMLIGSRDESDPAMRLWDVRAKEVLFTVRFDAGERQSVDQRHVALAPDGKLAAFAPGRRVVQIWDMVKGKELRRLPEVEHEIFCLAFSPDGKLVGAGNWDNTIRVYETQTGKELHHFGGHQGHVNAVAFSADGRTLASASSDTTVLLWSLETKR